MKLIATEFCYAECISIKSPDQHTKSLKRSVYRKYGKSKMTTKMAAKVINDHNFCSRTDILMKLVAKYMFSHISNSTKYTKITSGISQRINLRWPPRWLPKQDMVITYVLKQISQ